MSDYAGWGSSGVIVWISIIFVNPTNVFGNYDISEKAFEPHRHNQLFKNALKIALFSKKIFNTVNCFLKSKSKLVCQVYSDLLMFHLRLYLISLLELMNCNQHKLLCKCINLLLYFHVTQYTFWTVYVFELLSEIYTRAYVS